MEKIQHSYVSVRGLKLHVAEIGTGPAVVLLHGFPEIWYSWRHQMIALAAAGFRAIAPDYRGYGLSDKPVEPAKTTFKDLIDDLLGILDLYAIQKVFLVGKDLGVRPAYHFALVHPGRVSGVVTLGLPFLVTDPVTFSFDQLPEGYYVRRFQEIGRAEEDFRRFDVKTVIKKIYIMFSESELREAREDQEIMDLVDVDTPLPPWFSEDDLDNYAALYENSGFETPLQIPYRGWMEDYGVADPVVEAPALVIMGGKDYATKLLQLDSYISSGKAKQHVPNTVFEDIPEGSHFVQEQFPDQVNQLIIAFLNKHI